MFGFVRKKADVLNHWIAFVDGFNMPSDDFYKQVEETLRDSKVPEMQAARIDFLEGALLSDRRTYLRFVRERQVFDICACPFGKGFFFSCRTAVIPAKIQFWELIVFLIIGYLLLKLFTAIFGIIMGVPLLLGAFAAVIVALRQERASLHTLDAALIQTPVVRSFYELIRRETYFRHDTRLMYIDQVFRVVKATADSVTAAQGLKLIRQYAQAPLLGDLYQPIHDDLLVLQRADEALSGSGMPRPIIGM